MFLEALIPFFRTSLFYDMQTNWMITMITKNVWLKGEKSDRSYQDFKS